MKTALHRQFPNLLALALCLAMTAGCTKAAKARRLLSAAGRDFEAKRYDAAELEYESVLRLSRLNPVAIRQLGLLYYEDGRPEATAYLRKSFEQDPGHPQVRLRLAELYAAAGKTQDALPLLEPVLRSDPANDEALFLLAQITRTNDLPALRQRLQEQARPGGKGAAPCYSALAFIDFREQQLNQAEADLRKASDLDPKLASPHLAMAAVCSARNDLKGIENALKTAADLSPIRSSVRLKYVDFKIRTGATDQANELLREVTRQAPDYLPAWIHLMRLTFAERKFDDCKTIIDTILARDNTDFDALLQSANLALAQHDPAKAVGILDRMDSIPMYRNLPVIKYQMALAVLMNRETAKAIARLNDALALDSKYSPAALLLAELDIRTGNPGMAVSLLSQLLKNEPGNGRAYAMLAEAYLAQQQRPEALEVYGRMARVFPKNPEIPRLMALVYEQSGDIAQARAALDESLKLAPDYMPALRSITGLDITQKRFAQAHRRVAAVMDKDAKAAGPLMLEGDIYWAEGKTNEAELALSKAIELNPDLPVPYLMLAQLYLASHQEAQALQRLNTLVSKTNDLTAMLEIAEIHREAGRYDAAREAYEKLLALNPKSVIALNNLAYVYSEFLGRTDKAAQLAERARNLSLDDPKTADTLGWKTADTLGWILFKERDYTRALSLIQESADKQPGDAEVQTHLGLAYYMLQEENPARLALQQALASHTEFSGKEMARQSLANLNVDPATATPAVIEELEKQSHADPRDPVVMSRLAVIEERRGNIEKARDYYKTLLENNPQDLIAMVQLARLYYDRLHDTRKALELATSAHKLAPDDPRAAALLGELIYQSGDYPWAVSLLQQAATQLSGQPSLDYHLAWACYSAGRVADADAAMQRAVNSGQSFPDLEQAKQFLALRGALKSPGQARASSALVAQILQKEPNYVPALMVSEFLDEDRGAWQQASRTCEKVLAAYPLFVPAMRQLAILYCQHSGDQARAYSLALQAAASSHDDLELAKTLGILAYRRADYQTSLRSLRDHADQFGDDGEALGCLGLDYFHLKQRQQCKQVLQRALALNNIPAPLAAEARRALGELK
jgi:tetratricopeptide (TPR) repeat protein